METTGKVDCVFFNYLICSDLVGGTTYPVLLLLVPLLVLIIGAYWNHKRGLEEIDLEAHRAEASRLEHLLRKALDFSFQRTPLICATEYEVKYYKDVLKAYNNRGRIVELVGRIKTQNNHEHAASKAQTYRFHYSREFEVIEMGQENFNKHWDHLINKGLLDYLKTPKGSNWEKSKEYIDKATEYLVENDRPRPSDQAKKKLVLDIMSSDRIG
jgi:hypothetical protein